MFSLYSFDSFGAARLHQLAQLLERDAILRWATVDRRHLALWSRSTVGDHVHGAPSTPSLQKQNKQQRQTSYSLATSKLHNMYRLSVPI